MTSKDIKDYMLNMGAGYVVKVPAPEGGEGFINAKIVEK